MVAKMMNKQVFALLLTVLLMTLLLAIGITIYKYKMENIEKEYYKDQMLNFCEVTKVYQEDKYPELYPCERWIVK